MSYKEEIIVTNKQKLLNISVLLKQNSKHLEDIAGEIYNKDEIPENIKYEELNYIEELVEGSQSTMSEFHSNLSEMNHIIDGLRMEADDLSESLEDIIMHIKTVKNRIKREEGE